MLQIWVDGDACPKAIKAILYKAAIRTKTSLTIISNHTISTPPSIYIKSWVVSRGFDVADNTIIEHLQAGDLVITADIILADQVVSKKALALSPKGELFTITNIKQRLAMRNLSQTLRDTGLIHGGPNKLNPKEIQSFSNNLDKLLTQAKQVNSI